MKIRQAKKILNMMAKGTDHVTSIQNIHLRKRVYSFLD